MKDMHEMKCLRMSSSSVSSISIWWWVRVCRGDEGFGLSVFTGDTDGLNEHPSSHSREDAVDVVFLEVFDICDACDVTEPEILAHLVHGGVR